MSICMFTQVLNRLGRAAGAVSIQLQRDCFICLTQRCWLQFMEGGDLYSKLAEDDSGNYLWHRKGQHIALDVAKGVCFLHSKNIAHLDLVSCPFQPTVYLHHHLQSAVGVASSKQIPC